MLAEFVFGASLCNPPFVASSFEALCTTEPNISEEVFRPDATAAHVRAYALLLFLSFEETNSKAAYDIERSWP
jgi:hypothetical protein